MSEQVLPHAVLIAERFRSEDHWPGHLLAEFIRDALSQWIRFEGPIPSPGGTALLMRNALPGIDVVITCHYFMEYANGVSCHVYAKRRLTHIRGWLATRAQLDDAITHTGRLLDHAFANADGVELLGWCTDEQWRNPNFSRSDT